VIGTVGQPNESKVTSQSPVTFKHDDVTFQVPTKLPPQVAPLVQLVGGVVPPPFPPLAGAPPLPVVPPLLTPPEPPPELPPLLVVPPPPVPPAPPLAFPPLAGIAAPPFDEPPLPESVLELPQPLIAIIKARAAAPRVPMSPFRMRPREFLEFESIFMMSVVPPQELVQEISTKMRGPCRGA
jgi:hypothetical protein